MLESICNGETLASKIFIAVLHRVGLSIFKHTRPDPLFELGQNWGYIFSLLFGFGSDWLSQFLLQVGFGLDFDFCGLGLD